MIETQQQDTPVDLEHLPSLQSLLACCEPLAALAVDLFFDPEYEADLRRRLLRLLADFAVETLLDSGDPQEDMDDWLYQLLDALVGVSENFSSCLRACPGKMNIVISLVEMKQVELRRL